MGVRRLNLSRALVQTCRQWDNLRIEQTLFRGYADASDGITIHLRDRSIQARLLIGADGLHSRVRRSANLEGGPGSFRRLGARQHFHVAPWSDYVEVIHGPPGVEAYVTPCGKNMVGVAFLWHADVYRPARGGAGLIPSLFADFPGLAARLRSAAPASAPMGMGPLHRLAKRRCADGVLLIGDAGGYLDACTGEGISLALAQALALEQTVVPLLRHRDGSPRRSQLSPYEKACRRITLPYMQATRVLLLLNHRPAFVDRFIQVMRANPDILQHLFSAQMGQASFWPGWSKVFRLMHGLLVYRRVPPEDGR